MIGLVNNNQKVQKLSFTDTLTNNSILKINNASASADVITFVALSGLQKFNKLPETEQDKIKAFFKDLYRREKVVLLVAQGKKPAALGSFDFKHYETLDKHKNLLSSKKFHILIMDDKKSSQEFGHFRIIVLNKEETRKNIEQKLNYFKYRLNKPEATCDEVMKILTRPDSPLCDMGNNSDLIGIILGYPMPDVLLFKLYDDASTMYSSISSKVGAAQKKMLKVIAQILRSDLKITDNEGNLDIASRAKPFKVDKLDFPKTKSAFPYGKNYPFNFITWDRKSPELKKLTKETLVDMEAAKKSFPGSNKLLEHFLS